MGAAKKLIDKKVLRDLIPINALSANHVEEISKKALIEDVRSGTYVFKRGDRDYQTVYLLDGQVELLDERRDVVGTVSAGSEAARHPLAHKQPRQLGVRAAGKVTVARVDTSLLDVLLTWDESAGYDVVEIDAQEDDDWMTRMLQSQAFLQLPPANIHQLLMRLEAVSAGAGDIIVRQGDEGDYFYIVKSGRLAVSRKASSRSKEVLLAELGEGACFGEEALVSGTKRNASVMMITDGSLMRLSKNDFQELLCAPLVHEMDFDGAQKQVENGAMWLDVRLPGEFENQAIKGSMNLPLSALREQCVELDLDTDYVVCCDTGRRSAAAAFVLSQRGFTVYTLKNGLMDVPEAVLAGADGEEAARAAGEADIIPFEADSRPESKATVSPATDQAAMPADTDLIDKLAAVENIRQGLEQQLAQVQSQLEKAERRVEQAEARQNEGQSGAEQSQQEIAALTERLSERERETAQQLGAMEQDKCALQSETESLRDELNSSRQRLQTTDTEKQSLQEELNRLQQTLSQIQQSADGRDDALRHELEQMAARLKTEQQQNEKQVREVEQELSRVREDYQQLGQRTSAVAGERDAATREMQALKDQLAGLQEQLSNSQTEHRQALEAEQGESQTLRQKLEELENSRLQLEQQLAASSERSDAEKSASVDLQARLEVFEQQHQDLETTLQEANQQLESLQDQLSRQQVEATEENGSLQQRVEELQQQLEQTSGEIGAERDALAEGAAQMQQERQALEQERDTLGNEKQDLEQQLLGLQQALEEQQQQSLQQRSQQEALEQQLSETQQQLEKEAGQQQQSQAELEQGEEKTRQLLQQTAEADEKIAALEEELNRAQQQHTALEQRNSELDERLAVLTKEHDSDVASTREALSRAQTETENVKREQSRLMESLRKAEQNLERERHDHEAETRRLHKELKDAAGESNAGLAAELEALQGKLKEQAKNRDDLEIQLGDRSAQLEDVQADAEKLALQLQQAQDSARQAEQQLVEANQAANEEMAVRMEAEEKAQQALRDELAGTIAERNRSQEQLTVQLHELDELQVALETARQEAAAREEAAQAGLTALQQERDAALKQQNAIQLEVDQLRAEAEVTRGLVDMQGTPGGVDAALREELEQAKKNVDVAVRLRTQAEERNTELQAEIEALRNGLQAPASEPEGHIPSLDENDPHAAAVLSTGYSDSENDEPQNAAVLIEEDDASADRLSPGAATEVSTSSASGGGLKRVFYGVLIVALLAGAGLWWQSRQQPANLDTGAVSETAQSGVDVPAAARAEKPAPESTPGPESSESESTPASRKPPSRIPDFAKGSAGPANTAPEPERPAAEAKDARENKRALEVTEQTSPPKAVETESNLSAKPQPVRTYSEPLADGGRAPTLVEFQVASFDMGSSSSSLNFDERPRHRVQLRGFAISKHEITFAEYDRFARATGRRLPGDAGWGRGQRPVINVRWKDTLAYTQWLSEQTGSRYRLPTEAEWEFVARAGSDTRFWWGNKVGVAQANCFDCGGQWAGSKTAPVGSFAASPFGIQDMAGNVMEWVQDCYRPDYSEAPADGSAATSGDCGRRVVRGGGYGSPSESLRSASRDAREADTRQDNLGFRVVKE